MSNVKIIKNIVNRIIEGQVFEYLENGDTKSALELSMRKLTNRGDNKSDNIIERRMIALSAIGASREELVDFVETTVGIWYLSKGTIPTEDVADSLSITEVMGRVQVPNINNISSEEFNPYQHLSDYLGIGREELRVLVSTGSLRVDDFRKAMRSAVSTVID